MVDSSEEQLSTAIDTEDIAAPHTIEEQFTRASFEEEQITGQYGDHPLAFYGLAPEDEHFLAPNGEGLINYRVTKNVAVVLGDPVCSPDAEDRVIQSFLEFCKRHRWHTAFYQVYPKYLSLYRARHFRAFKMGEEAFINPQTFTLKGSAIGNVRTSSRRAERDGATIQWYEGVLPTEVLQQLEQLSTTWLKNKSGEQAKETSFSVGRFDEINASAELADRIAAHVTTTNPTHVAPPRFLTAIAMTKEGKASAFMTFTPVYGNFQDDLSADPQWGWTLDIMRRTSSTLPGVMELLLVRAIERFRDSGANTLSLGLVAWSDTLQEMSPLQRKFAGFITDRMHLLETHNSLFKFKQKFLPRWESRYLVTRTDLSFPFTILGVMRVRNYARGTKKRVAQRERSTKE